MADGAAEITVEVAYALAERQLIVTLQVPAGTTAGEAIALADLDEHFPSAQLDEARIGIFSRLVKRDRVLRDGDRVEIYRPLLADPREVRRQLAAEGKTMGRPRDED